MKGTPYDAPGACTTTTFSGYGIIITLVDNKSFLKSGRYGAVQGYSNSASFDV